MHRYVSSEASRRNIAHAPRPAPAALLAEIDAILAARPKPQPLPRHTGKPVDLGPIPAHVVVTWGAWA